MREQTRGHVPCKTDRGLHDGERPGELDAALPVSSAPRCEVSRDTQNCVRSRAAFTRACVARAGRVDETARRHILESQERGPLLPQGVMGRGAGTALRLLNEGSTTGTGNAGRILMNTTASSPWMRAFGVTKALFWMALAVMVLHQLCGRSQIGVQRAALLAELQQQRKSRVIALIHRQETVSLFGVPVSSFIDIEDSEAVLRAIRLTPADQPIDLVLHTPGGLVLAAEQIAHALVEHRGKVTVFIPHYAMSGGTLLALTADDIVMDPNAVLGPVDPQIGDQPAASIVKVLSQKPVAQISDDTLVLADMAQKARVQVATFVADVLLKHLPRDRATALATTLSEGRWTHDFPITVEAARQLGLPVSTEMPPLIYQLMDLYPQSGTGRPSVMYVPLRRDDVSERGPSDNPRPSDWR